MRRCDRAAPLPAGEDTGGQRAGVEDVGTRHHAPLVEHEARGVDAESAGQHGGQPCGDAAERRRRGEHALHGPQRLVPLALPPRAGGEAADERTREREHGEGDDAFGGRARRPVALDLAQDERPEGEHGPDRGH
ncbi:MAG: hypothetical protein DMD76_30185, partial [Candidatus Rokuibacteriota bacterium]